MNPDSEELSDSQVRPVERQRVWSIPYPGFRELLCVGVGAQKSASVTSPITTVLAPHQIKPSRTVSLGIKLQPLESAQYC